MAHGLILALVVGASPYAHADEPKAAPKDCSRVPGGRTLELAGVYFVEAWDLNGRPRARLQGGAVAVSLPIHDGLETAIELLTVRVAPLLRNATVAGVSALVRKRLAERGQNAFFVEGGVGASYATVEVPDRGTRFNYLLQAGGGLAHRVGRRASLLLGVRVFHLSNNSLNGPDQNPDIEAVGGHFGVIVSF